MKSGRVPEATITRLSVYSKHLWRLERKGVETVSSVDIAEGVGVSPAQVRKDLAYFGEFGTRGVGYNVKSLLGYTKKILGLTHQWDLIIVGAGNLGTALCMYREFRNRGFNIVGIFDNDLSKIGKTIDRSMDLVVKPLEEMKDLVDRKGVKIGIIAVPARAAQWIADIMVNSGLKAILNFAPASLSVPEDINVRNMDLSAKLEILTFHLTFDEYVFE